MRTSESAKQLKPFIVSWIDRILANGARDLGTPSAPFDTIYADTVQADTIIGVLTGAEWEVAGNPIIDANQASTTSTVYIVNQAAGGVANLDVENNIIVGGLVDGVDIAAHAADANAHHNQSHVLATAGGLGADHTVSGLTAGHVLRASGATAAAFAQLAHDDLSGIGSNSHSQIDSHIANTSNPHTVTPAQLGLVIGTDVQAWDADLDAIAALTPTDSNFIVGNGSAWVAESGNTARTSLGLGTGDSPQFTGLTVSGQAVLSAGVGSYGDGRIKISSSGDVFGITLNSTSRVWDIISIVSTSPDVFGIYDATAGATRLQIDESGNVGIAGLTASRLLSADSSKNLASVADLTAWIATASTNRVTVTDDGDGSVTLSGPQDIHTGATPTFADLTLSAPSAIYALNHDQFANFVANEHIDHTTVSITAGAGLTGGGTIAATRTVNVGQGAGITVNADDVALTTPGTLTVSTSNSSTGNHTHAITSSSNPGAAASILASDGSGQLQLVRIGLGIAPNGSYSLLTSGAGRFGGSVSLSAGNLAFESSSFVSGWAGSGFRLEDSIAVASTTALEIDEMTVRGRLRVYELLVQQLRATNGSVVVANTGKAETVTDNGGGSYTIDTDQYHGFAVNDLIRAQRFTGTGVYQSNLTVTAVASATQFTATLSSGDAPTAGMEFVRLGNTSDTSRQGAVYLTADDTYAPYIDILDGVSDWAHWGTADKTKVRLGKLTGISDAAFGGALSGYGLYSINAYLKGALVAGNGGEVVADDGGISILAATSVNDDLNAYTFRDSGGTTQSGMWAVASDSDTAIQYGTAQIAGKTATVYVASIAGSGYGADLFLQATGVSSSSINLYAVTGNRSIHLDTTKVDIDATLVDVSGRIDVAGNVNAGGAVNGAYALNVSGDGYLDGDVEITGDVFVGWNNSFRTGDATYQFKIHQSPVGYLPVYFDNTYDDASASINFRMRTSGSAVDAITILGSGNVGIGTNDPQAALHAFKQNTTSRTSAQDILYLGTSHAETGYDGFGTAIVDYRRTYQNSNAHAINRIRFIERGNSINDFGGAIAFDTKSLSSGSTAPVERMRIDYTGNVYIDTDTLYVDAANDRVGVNVVPSYPLDVSGNVRLSGNVGIGDTPDTYALKVNGDMYANRVGLGTAPDANWRLYVSGTSNLSGSLIVQDDLDLSGNLLLDGYIDNYRGINAVLPGSSWFVTSLIPAQDSTYIVTVAVWASPSATLIEQATWMYSFGTGGGGVQKVGGTTTEHELGTVNGYIGVSNNTATTRYLTIAILRVA